MTIVITSNMRVGIEMQPVVVINPIMSINTDIGIVIILAAALSHHRMYIVILLWYIRSYQIIAMNTFDLLHYSI